jgi:transposase, IS5 family
LSGHNPKAPGFAGGYLRPTIEVHEAKLGRMPRLVAADAGFCSDKNEAAAKAKGVKRVCIPNRSSKSAACKRMRGTHQCEQATTWSPAVPISW